MFIAISDQSVARNTYNNFLNKYSQKLSSLPSVLEGLGDPIKLFNVRSYQKTCHRRFRNRILRIKQKSRAENRERFRPNLGFGTLSWR